MPRLLCGSQVFSLHDIASRFADITPLEETLAYIEGLPERGATAAAQEGSKL